MSDERPESAKSSPQAGILGNLPNSRPAVRSPRRSTEPPKQREEPAEAAEKEASTDAHEATPEQPIDLEALAKGGIAVAGEAATLGLRLAGRAAAALRDAVERR
ncbi:MAG: hypothetical protein KDB58_13590 [Solirubrobacterales bacterium]|nr:hypothetical protein [Solirubrobacterales bacterium]MCB8969404.1 hypothetical protein [Thermoleophilales bacterium]MCO5327338.1 hypothetical protein [Solirubrobacterales bacterium]